MKLRDRYNCPVDLNKLPTMVYSEDRNICIHVIGLYGKGWFLSCRVLNISDLNLHTEDFKEAVKKAKFELCCKLKSLDESISGFINSDFEVDVCPAEVLADHRDTEVKGK